MDKQHPVSDPFALMMNPQSVIDAMERSDRLARLQRRICRPLDKPLIPCSGTALEAFDSAIDSLAEPDEV